MPARVTTVEHRAGAGTCCGDTGCCVHLACSCARGTHGALRRQNVLQGQFARCLGEISRKRLVRVHNVPNCIRFLNELACGFSVRHRNVHFAEARVRRRAVSRPGGLGVDPEPVWICHPPGICGFRDLWGGLKETARGEPIFTRDVCVSNNPVSVIWVVLRTLVVTVAPVTRTFNVRGGMHTHTHATCAYM